MKITIEAPGLSFVANVSEEEGRKILALVSEKCVFEDRGTVTATSIRAWGLNVTEPPYTGGPFDVKFAGRPEQAKTSLHDLIEKIENKKQESNTEQAMLECINNLKTHNKELVDKNRVLENEKAQLIENQKRDADKAAKRAGVYGVS
jgi:hypothetical protein